MLCFLCSLQRALMVCSPPPLSLPPHLPAQVVSTAVSYYTRGLPPLTFSGGSKVPPDYWGGKQSGESEMIFHK